MSRMSRFGYQFSICHDEKIGPFQFCSDPAKFSYCFTTNLKVGPSKQYAYCFTTNLKVEPSSKSFQPCTPVKRAVERYRI